MRKFANILNAFNTTILPIFLKVNILWAIIILFYMLEKRRYIFNTRLVLKRDALIAEEITECKTEEAI